MKSKRFPDWQFHFAKAVKFQHWKDSEVYVVMSTVQTASDKTDQNVTSVQKTSSPTTGITFRTLQCLTVNLKKFLRLRICGAVLIAFWLLRRNRIARHIRMNMWNCKNMRSFSNNNSKLLTFSILKTLINYYFDKKWSLG